MQGVSSSSLNPERNHTMKYITLKQIKAHNPCASEFCKVKRFFGKRTRIAVSVRLAVSVATRFDFDWLTEKLLTPAARKAYAEARAAAWKAYHEGEAPAEKAYDEARAAAEKAYAEARAPAEKAYAEARAPALKAYREVAAARLVKALRSA